MTSDLNIVSKPIAEMLRSTALHDAWGLYHHSERDKNPAHNLAEKLDSLTEDNNKKEIYLTFMREFIEIQRRVLENIPSKKIDEVNVEREKLEALAATLEGIFSTKGIESFPAATLRGNLIGCFLVCFFTNLHPSAAHSLGRIFD